MTANPRLRLGQLSFHEVGYGCRRTLAGGDAKLVTMESAVSSGSSDSSGTWTCSSRSGSRDSALEVSLDTRLLFSGREYSDRRLFAVWWRREQRVNKEKGKFRILVLNDQN